MITSIEDAKVEHNKKVRNENLIFSRAEEISDLAGTLPRPKYWWSRLFAFGRCPWCKSKLYARTWQLHPFGGYRYYFKCKNSECKYEYAETIW